MSGNIKVVVRCRPLNSREIARGAKGLVRMEGINTYLDPPEVANVSSGRATERETKSFAFDKSYWSACAKDEPGYASQDTLYNDLGKDLLDHSFAGYNACIFAYGQTGSGKSYSMMGYQDKGLIPLICEALFERITELSTDTLSFNVEVSYIEIYQEKVRDLLNPRNKDNLKVREHPTLGPYVECSKLVVESYVGVETLMDEGTKARTVAATNMNETSSRSHSIFTLMFTQRRLDQETGISGEKVSRISLVDLAGSERANATGATGTRLKEGALINKSLTTLGRVIAALASASSQENGKGTKSSAVKVPYRDSVLTWLLKDSLGGNSKTAMVAAISPADYEETLSTLRYADQAKKIKNKAVVNEDPNAKLIRELKEELAILRTRITGAASESNYDPNTPPEQQIVQYRGKDGELKTITKADLQDQLQASEKLMASVQETWEEKLARTQEIQKERELALEGLGITIEKNLVGVHTPKKTPHLVNLNEDPLMSECLIYQIKSGTTMVGNISSEKHADIRLSGASILPEHCFFENTPDGKVALHALPESSTMVNGLRIPSSEPRRISSGDRIILGDFHIFRFNHPEEVRKARGAGGPMSELRSPLLHNLDELYNGSSSPANRADSPLSTAGDADWSYARREAVVATLNGSEVNLDNLKDEDLNRLFADLVKVRHARGSSITSLDPRSDSRMSYLGSVDEEDDDSRGSPSIRAFSGGTWSTSVTSVGDSSTPTLNLPSEFEVEERLQAVKEEYEEKIRTMIESAAQVEEVQEQKKQMEDKLKTMEENMEAQKKLYDSRVKRLKGTNEELFDSEPLSQAQEILAREVISKWKGRKRIQMAEIALSQALTLKEANVISRELKKGVLFQFVVVEGEVPISANESSLGLTDIDDLSDPILSSSLKPCIGVKVLDRKNQSIYVWSIAKFHQRLQQMRNLYKFIGTEYSHHFSWEDPFYESPLLPGNYSYIGSAVVSLLPLSRNLPSSSNLQIFSPYTADPIGSLRVSIKPISVILSDGIQDSNDSITHPPISPFVNGSKLSLEILVDQVKGLSNGEFTSVHLQMNLANLFGSSFPSEVFSSPPINLDSSSSSIQLGLKRIITIIVTSDIQYHFRNGLSSIEVFAQVKYSHLDKIENWDEARMSATTSKLLNTPSLRGDPTLTDVTRRPEGELISDQQHDVMVSVEIRELGEGGEYLPARVVSSNNLDSGAFFLRQGLQRRFVLKLSHNSGKGWKWRKVSKVVLGNVRMLDGKGSVHATTKSIDVELRQIGNRSRPSFESDGTASLSFSAAWDSSVHDSTFLNKNTSPNHRVLLRLVFEVEADNCSSPIPFVMDIAVTVQSRDARPPSNLFSMLLKSSRISSRITSLFNIRLTPFMTKKPTDIWRLNTAETFVRGEELLENWKPRGLSLIRDHDTLVKDRRKLADVEAAKAILQAFELTLPSLPLPEGMKKEDILSQTIDIWQKRFGFTEEISLDREDHTPPSTLDLSPSISTISLPLRERKLTGTATMISKSETASRRGTLAMLRDPTSESWSKNFVVLRRPYLYLYNSSSDTQEHTVINISTVRVEQSPEIEQMLDRKFSFAIFTHQNSYFFQAPSAVEMNKWILSIDPSLV